MADTVVVKVNDGKLRGKKASSESGKTYYSFQGIPYAKPPVGPLRFKVAEPPEPWDGIRDALQEGNAATQYNLMTLRYEGSEDCLYLNVYTPQLPENGSQSNLKAVMFWIHGGGYVCGSGNSEMHGPDFLVDEDVVIVSINYRLGIFGFLYLNDSTVPGNLGLRDQVEALRWVQKNIIYFGGDPNNVTIFGVSAGGASVHMQLLSPMSKGLFHRAIAQSAAAFNPWALERHPREMAFRVGKALGFLSPNPTRLVQYLCTVDHMTLVKTAFEHAFGEEDKQRLLTFAFVPTVEVDEGVEEKFLPAHPLELLENGSYHKVPYMTGFVEKEGLLLFKFRNLNEKSVQQKIEDNFTQTIAPDLHLPEGCNKTDEAIAKIKHFFLNNKPINEETKNGFVDLTTDILFAEGIFHTVNMMAQHAKSPVYYYFFAYEGKLNLFKHYMGIKEKGACHGDDVGYLFRMTMFGTVLEISPSDAITRARMVKLWTNFAKTGHPTPGGDPLLPVTWEPHTPGNPCYLNINEELSIEQSPCKERVKFWEELYSSLK